MKRYLVIILVILAVIPCTQADLLNISEHTCVSLQAGEDVLDNHEIVKESNDTLHIITTTVDASPLSHIDHYRSTDNGSTWSSPTNISTLANMENCDAPAAVIDSYDNVHVVFYSKLNGDSLTDVYYTNYTNTTGNWITPIKISTLDRSVSNNSRSPAIGIDEVNDLHVLWEAKPADQGLNDDYQIYYTTYNITNHTWSTPVQISDDTLTTTGNDYYEYADIAVCSSTNIYAFYSVVLNSGIDRVLVIHHNGTSWSTQTTLSGGSGNVVSYHPMGVCDSNGYAFAIFEYDNYGLPAVGQIRVKKVNNITTLETYTATSYSNAYLQPMSISITESDQVTMTYNYGGTYKSYYNVIYPGNDSIGTHQLIYSGNNTFLRHNDLNWNGDDILYTMEDNTDKFFCNGNLAAACTEDWSELHYYEYYDSTWDCNNATGLFEQDYNDTLYYVDLNSCGTTDDLPVDNGTETTETLTGGSCVGGGAPLPKPPTVPEPPPTIPSELPGTGDWIADFLLLFSQLLLTYWWLLLVLLLLLSTIYLSRKE